MAEYVILDANANRRVEYVDARTRELLLVTEIHDPDLRWVSQAANGRWLYAGRFTGKPTPDSRYGG